MLGTVDFSGVQELEAVETGIYEGQTKNWEAVENSNHDGMHIKANFMLQNPEDGRNFPLFTRWPLKVSGLWRTKRDLVALGANPEDLSGANVNLEAVINDIFGAVPTPVRASVKKVPARDSNGNVLPPDPLTGKQKFWNELESVQRIG